MGCRVFYNLKKFLLGGVPWACLLAGAHLDMNNRNLSRHFGGFCSRTLAEEGAYQGSQDGEEEEEEEFILSGP